jgi:hypothetical protein
MKRITLLFCFVLLIVCVGVGINHAIYANPLAPSSLLDVNTLPAVATDSNDNFTITWGYLGLGHLPGILAKQYYANGTPVDATEFWVNSSASVSSLLNYDPDIATDSTNNAVIVWCSYSLTSTATNTQVVYTKVRPPFQAGASAAGPLQATAISPHQEDGVLNPLSFPLAPVVAVDSSDNIAIAWSYFDISTGESGIYLVVIDPSGTAGTPVKVVDNWDDSLIFSAAGDRNNPLSLSQIAVKPVFYYAPSIAFDVEGNIVVTWTETGLVPFVLGDISLPRTAIFYSKYSTSGSVVSGYDKQMVGTGFNSAVAVNESGTMIIVWNTLDIFSFKTRINAALFAGPETPAEDPIQLGTRSGYTPSAFVDAGNDLFNSGIDIVANSEGNFLVTWGGSNLFSSHVYLKEVDSVEGYLSNEMQVSQGVQSNHSPSIATDSQGNIVITWNKVTPANLFTGFSSIFARRYDSNLQALGDEFKVNFMY